MVGADYSSNEMQISRSRWQDLCLLVCVCCNRDASFPSPRDTSDARRSQTTYRPATTFSGNSFRNYFFLFFLLSQRENAFWLVRIDRRTTCRSAEARDKTCALLYMCAATGMPVLQRHETLLMRVDRKRCLGQQQHSREILFVTIFFYFFYYCRERTRFGWCGMLVERHADQQKHAARLVPCCMCVLQSGRQSHNELQLSCCASIANNNSAKNNSLGKFFS